MKNTLLYLMLTLLLAAAGPAIVPTTGAAATSPLVTTDWLEKNLGARDLVIIDTRTPTNYGVGHIPGSYNLPYANLEPMSEKKHCQLMSEHGTLTDMLQAVGVGTNSHVVVYDHGNTISDASKGGAALWVLEAVGVKNVSYLDGGFTKWTFEGRIIDNKVPEAKNGSFAARVDPTRVLDKKSFLKKVGDKNVILVDARTTGQHFGDSKRADVERYGHVPGSISLPASLLTHAGINRAPATIKPKKVLEEIAKGVGLPADHNREIVIYCNTGQYAGLDYFVLRDLLGYKNVSVYDGSMLEYAADEAQPLVRFTWGRGR